jgi:hypothetical protein
MIFIQYNNYNEYSYSIVFSHLELDRIRYDNYDTDWDIPSKPNHYHPRKEKSGKSSPMIGNPQKDMLLLTEIIQLGKF